MLKMKCFNIVIVVWLVMISTKSFAQETEYFGIYSDRHFNPELEFDIDIALYLWEETGSLAEKNDNYSYIQNYMSFVYNHPKRWFGFGYAVVPDNNFANMSRFENGRLSVTMKARGELPASFEIGLKSGLTRGGEAWVDVKKYGFENDGEWTTLNIPISDFIDANKFFDLSQVSQYFMIVGKGNVPPNHGIRIRRNILGC